MKKIPRISGLYAITPDTWDTERLVQQVASVLAGGASIVQYRHKGGHAALRRAQAAALVEECRARGALFLVNDDVELALEVGADGVHLGRQDMAVMEARQRLGVNAVIGASCYNELWRGDRAAAAGADYLAFGSFFPSSTKPHAQRATFDILSEARRRWHLPLVAIGGITVTNAGSLIECGADALAVISALFDADDAQAAAREFTQLFEHRLPA
ncbi:MAG TPA: thiamine phosphate synthase [Burkholderiales bacterium]|nr:thiamine phosphate synthase [Burkholderiales bacterium]